jgi:signal transduction histidine kinase
MKLLPAALLRTTTFRVAIAFAGLFAGSAALLLAWIYVATVGRMASDADQAVQREMGLLLQRHAEGGVGALNAELVQRAAASELWLYVLIRPDGRALSGNLSAVPIDLGGVRRVPPGGAADPREAIVSQFAYERPDPADGRLTPRAARGRFVALPGDYGVFVARDLGDGATFAAAVSRAVALGGAGFVLLALIGGYLSARQAARRAGDLTATTQAVMAGNLGTRAPVRRAGDEFDQLARDLNAMLDRLERLVAAARTTGDSVAHDLRSPLARMRSRLEAALDGPAEPAALKAALERGVADVDAVIGTFDAVLRLSRLESGQGGRLTEVDVSALVEELGELYEPVFEDKGLAFACETATGLKLAADRSLLAQAVTNLLDNALKYTPSGGVTLRARATRAGAVEISVTDTGPGVPEADRERVKERFVRLDKARTEQGSGLGLALASAVAELHGGRLELTEGAGDPSAPGLRAALVLGKSPP